MLAATLPAGASPRSGRDTRTASSLQVAPVVLHPCPGDPGYRCGAVPVPLNYSDPSARTLPLAVIERPAGDPSQRIGALFMNPGGPGESGVEILPVLASLLPAALLDRFDLVSFDERGTGDSMLLDCGPAPAAAASVAPLPARTDGPLPASVLYRSTARSCDGRYPGLAPTVDTTTSARDMDVIRQALGLRTISYYGLSYGTVLGSVYAALFPTRLRAAVLDGAVVPTLPLQVQAAEEAPAAEAALHHFFSTTCAALASCPLLPDPAASYARLEASLARRPLPAPGDGDDLPVTVGDLDAATLLYLTVPKFAPSYLPALRAAMDGDGAPLRELSLAFQQDLNGSSLIGPEWAFTCQDATSRPSARLLGAEAQALARRQPLIGLYTPTYVAAGCADWPRATQPVTSLRLRAGPELLVIGNVGDPNTPHVAAVQLAAALGRATLLTWDGWGHTWLLNGSSDPCMSAAVTGYLVSLQAPRSGSACP